MHGRSNYAGFRAPLAVWPSGIRLSHSACAFVAAAGRGEGEYAQAKSAGREFGDGGEGDDLRMLFGISRPTETGGISSAIEERVKQQGPGRSRALADTCLDVAAAVGVMIPSLPESGDRGLFPTTAEGGRGEGEGAQAEAVCRGLGDGGEGDGPRGAIPADRPERGVGA